MSNEMTSGSAELLPDPRRRDDAADRARLHHGGRPLGRDLRRHHAAVRPHDREIAAKADVAEARLEALHVAADLRADIGVHHRGRHALVLAVLAQDLVRQRQIDVRHRRPDHLAGCALVLGIDVGVQEAHRDRLDALGFERRARLGDAALLQRLVHLAGGEQALLRLVGEPARHQRPVAVEEQVVGLRPVAAADDVDVARAARHHQAGLGALALDQRVDRDGRAVDQLVDVGGVEPALADAVDDALHELRRRGQALGLDERAGPVVEPDQVGERPADVDRDEDHAFPSTFSARHCERSEAISRNRARMAEIASSPTISGLPEIVLR